MAHAPDVLDALGLAILEVGGVQLAVESARIYWPSGEARVTLLVQAAWSGTVNVELALVSGDARAVRQATVRDTEVRRQRIPLSLPSGAAPISLQVKSTIPADAERVRPAWLKDQVAPEPKPDASMFGAIAGALKFAVGKREKKVEARGPEQGALAVELEAVGGAPPIAAEDEAFWQPGMPAPEATGELRVAMPAPPMSTETRTATRGDRIECPHCFALAYVEEVRVELRCPSCAHDWRP